MGLLAYHHRNTFSGERCCVEIAVREPPAFDAQHSGRAGGWRSHHVGKTPLAPAGGGKNSEAARRWQTGRGGEFAEAPSVASFRLNTPFVCNRLREKSIQRVIVASFDRK